MQWLFSQNYSRTTYSHFTVPPENVTNYRHAQTIWDASQDVTNQRTPIHPIALYRCGPSNNNNNRISTAPYSPNFIIKREACIDDERQFNTAKRPQAPGDATVQKRFFIVIFRRRSKRIAFLESVNFSTCFYALFNFRDHFIGTTGLG